MCSEKIQYATNSNFLETIHKVDKISIKILLDIFVVSNKSMKYIWKRKYTRRVRAFGGKNN
jgi:hypothetical protein